MQIRKQLCYRVFSMVVQPSPVRKCRKHPLEEKSGSSARLMQTIRLSRSLASTTIQHSMLRDRFQNNFFRYTLFDFYLRECAKHMAKQASQVSNNQTQFTRNGTNTRRTHSPAKKPSHAQNFAFLPAPLVDLLMSDL